MEQWKQINGFTNYAVSNLGNIKNTKKGKLLNPSIDNKGYLRVSLCENGVRSVKKVHRLVAEAFIPNPEKYDCVNHKDEKKTNNESTNLEWCTVAYNNSYGTNQQRTSLTLRNRPHLIIGRFSLDNILEKTYNGLREVQEDGFNSGNVSACCRNVKWHNTAYGYIWKYLT